MIDGYLKATFGEDITQEPFGDELKLPLIIRDTYDFSRLEIKGCHCVVLHYKGIYLSTDRIKAHFRIIKNTLHHHLQIILWFDSLTTNQRKNLIKENIAFIVPPKQIFLPFLYLKIDDTVTMPKHDTTTQFTTAMQCVYIWLFFHDPMPISNEQISSSLRISRMTVTRAFQYFQTHGLVNTLGTATRAKRTRCALEVFWQEGRKQLCTPVMRTFFCKRAALSEITAYAAAETALSSFSMLNAPSLETFAVDAGEALKIKHDLMEARADLEGVDHVQLQIWKYDPGLFASVDMNSTPVSGNVDIVSLYASLLDADDVRVADAADDMMKGYIANARN